jgi:uncharacterized membrane protein YeaQ/YmgE (transglycosylase-associated protein family)
MLAADGQSEEVRGMLDLVGWNLGIGAWAALALVVGGLLLGLLAQSIGEVVAGYEWSLTAVAGIVGGWLGSEAFGSASTWGPEWDGLFIVPAIIGGVVLGVVIDLIARWITGGSLIGHHRAI